jgi:TPR repeat protein
MNICWNKTILGFILLLASIISLPVFFSKTESLLIQIDDSSKSEDENGPKNSFDNKNRNEGNAYLEKYRNSHAGATIQFPYKNSLERLRKSADSGNVRAACQLAWVLDACAREQASLEISSVWNSIDSIEKENIYGVEAIEKKIMFAEVVKTACDGFETDDYHDADKRMLDAAKMGSVKSMVRFALMTPRYGSDPDSSDESFLKVYGKNAVLFLHRAAEYGDREALFGIYRAYRFGYIDNAWGNVSVGEDLTKAVAAAVVLAKDADPENAHALNQFIFESKAVMSRDQIERAAEIEAVYLKNYRIGSNSDSHETADTDPLRDSDCG